METQNKYLTLARRARQDNNAEDAKKYYDLVRTDDPENIEAKFFYSYYKLLDSTQGQAAGEFINYCNGLNSTISMLIDSDYSKEEKISFFRSIYDCTQNAYDIAYRSNRNIGGSDGGTIFKTFNHSADNIFSRIKTAYPEDVDMTKLQFTLRNAYLIHMKGHLSAKNLCNMRFELGDEIENTFGSDAELIKIAVTHWKDAVADGQNWPGVVEDNTKIVKYADKIKKYDPSYVMPEAKKRGCITIGK